MPSINLNMRTGPKVKKTINKDFYQKIYQSAAWRRLKAAKLRENPLCEVCESKGKTTPTQEVHHIIPFIRGKSFIEVEELAYDYDNLMSVCIDCHNDLHKELKLKNPIR